MSGKSAVMSECGTYRYHLARSVGPVPGSEGICLFVMLNPSTADAYTDDPTIRRCKGFARREGCTDLEVVNLFALRATNPDALVDEAGFVNPIGTENDEWIRDRVAHARIIIAAWGTRGALMGRDAIVRAMLPGGKTYALGLTKDGHPRHPLYVRADAPLAPFGAKP